MALAQLVAGSGLQIQAKGERSFSLVSAGPRQSATQPTTAVSTATDSGASKEAEATENTKKNNDLGGPNDARPSGRREVTEEIVVTAQKREERLIDVPISIAVINSETIGRRGLIGAEDYLRDVPGVNQIDQGPTSNAIVIRGITTSPQFENFSSGTTTASYFGETPITAAGGLGAGGIDVRPVDIARIEVLRGPQGTTYGNASLGGAVRMIPAPPQLDRYVASVEASYSDTSGHGSDNTMIQGVLNTPIVSDRFGLRAVGYRYEDSGYYTNVVGENPAMLAVADRFGADGLVRGYLQDDVGHILTTGGRVAALWQATERLELTLNFLTQTIEQDGWPVSSVGTYEQSRFPIAPQARLRGEAGEVSDTNMDLANLVVNYDLSWANLTTTFSWIDSGSAAAAATFTDNPRSSTNESFYEALIGEARLVSNFSGPLQFLAGVYYEDIDEDFTQTSDWPGAPSLNPFLTDPILNFAQNRDLQQSALFGEVHYKLTEKLTATVGARFFEYDKKESTLSEGGLVRVPLGTGVRAPFDTTESNNSFKGNLSYKPTESSLLYASWSEGFRLGRATAGLPVSSCDVNNDGIVDGANFSIESSKIIDSDYLENYEVGTKAELFDRRLVVDAAVYYIKWDGLPIRSRAPSPCNQIYTANVGTAESKGVEVHASVLVTDALRLEVGASYNNAELAEAAPVLQAPAGAPLPGSPDVNASLAAQYDFQVFGRDAFVRADSMYASEFYGDVIESPGTRAGDYIKVDARAGIAVGGVTAALFIRNLTNEDAFTWRGLNPAGDYFGYRLRPRTIGIQLGYRFD
jgi:outer membrane receptor protein involved in Fe transport